MSALTRFPLFFSRDLPLTYRLEGLAGLSVQDAELKLFAENTAADAPAGGAHESSSSTRSSVDRDAPRDTTAATLPGSEKDGKKKKKKRAKKQPAVTQRGPLLITHTGEMHKSRLSSSPFRLGMCVYGLRMPGCALMLTKSVVLPVLPPWKLDVDRVLPFGVYMDGAHSRGAVPELLLRAWLCVSLAI